MDKVKSVFLLVAALAFAISPFTTDGFNGFTAGQFPIPQDDPAVQPAGYAFSIWGLIYAWLIIGAGYGLLRRDRDADWSAMRLPLIGSLVVGAAWIPVANMDVLAATVMIWLMWLGAVVSLLMTGHRDRWWQRSPVAIYAGWLTAASCVALGLVLAGYGFVSEQSAALLMIALAALLALGVQSRRVDTPEYGAAVIWALVGVIVANTGGSGGVNWAINWPVIGACLIAIAALAYVISRPARAAEIAS